MKVINAKGLSCPEPVLLAKRAVEAGDFPFTILVDDETPRENILRFANNNNYRAVLVEKDDHYAIEFTR